MTGNISHVTPEIVTEVRS